MNIISTFFRYQGFPQKHHIKGVDQQKLKRADIQIIYIIIIQISNIYIQIGFNRKI